MVVILLAVPLVVVGPVLHTDAATTGGSVSGILPGYQQPTSDQLSPLIITTLAPDPVPVKGSDNQFHVHYELSVFNDAPRAATLTKVETLSNGRSRTVTHTITGSEIVARSLLTASYPTTPAPVSEIPAGRTLILILDDVYPTRQAVPTSVTHRISATFGPITSGDGGPASLYPDHATQFGGPVRTSTLRPLVIAPPIAGTDWEASNGCCGLNAHGNVVLPLGGRLNGAERFAVDWVRVNLAAKPLVENGMEVTWAGDPSVNQSYLAFDQPVLAVADGTVVSAVSDQPDQPPGQLPSGIPLDQLTGNSVVLDLGHHVFATYGHLKAASVGVTVGEKVRTGQVIGRVGNSGNSSAPHLHFQLQSGPLPLSSNEVPWEINTFTLVGTVTVDGLIDQPKPGPRRYELPLGETVSMFRS